jgi:hypothetical protein
MENLAKALVKAQSQLRNLGKNAQGYGYGYLTLDKLIDETRGVLADSGLVIIQPMNTTARPFYCMSQANLSRANTQSLL